MPAKNSKELIEPVLKSVSVKEASPAVIRPINPLKRYLCDYEVVQNGIVVFKGSRSVARDFAFNLNCSLGISPEIPVKEL